MILLIICFALFLLFGLISAKYKVYDIEYNSNKKSHKALLICSTGFCVAVSIIIFSFLSTESLKYPFEYPVFYYNGYEQLFDALMKHQLNLDIEVDELFSIMNNPYDWNERKMLGVSYPWDRVLFNGQYYSYFGIAPIILIYFPFYFITGKVPTSQTVCFILTLITIISLALLTIKLFKLFCKKTNLFLLTLSLLAVESGSLIFMVQSSADMYYTALCSGVTFLTLFLLFTFSAFDSDKITKKSIYFALSGISLSFLVMSRPNLAIFFILAIPVYISVLISKKYNNKQKFMSVISFAIPVIIGALFVMWYNYQRFGSVIEFGAKYQLTVYDVSKYAITPALIIPSIYYYFVQLAEYTKSFPYISIPFVPLTSYSKYIYCTSTIGLLSFPSIWGLGCLPASLSKKESAVKKSVFSLAIILCLFLAFFDTCMAGVNIRYVVDIALISVLFSVLILSDFYNIFDKSKSHIKYVMFMIITILLLATFVIGLLLILNNERDYLLKLFN